MKEGWKTHAIGRHLVDLPATARIVESYKINSDAVEPLTPDEAKRFARVVDDREAMLRKTMRTMRPESMFVERVQHPNGSVTLVSWKNDDDDDTYRFDTYFKAGDRAMKYSGNVSFGRKKLILDWLDKVAREWRETPSVGLPEGIGFVTGDTMWAANRLNYESWRMSIKLANKPDVSFEITAYAQGKVDPGLRERAGGAVASLLGTIAGFAQLRNRERPVGPIQADEILLAGTQNGKRGYGFKWEAPGKVHSLAEPNLNVTLEVRESAYTTNKESFASDEEALELWDAVVNSIRLRPGAV